MAVLPVALTEPPDTERAIARPRVLNLLVNPEHVVTILLGSPGSGKSIAAKQAADARAVRLVWVRLAPGYGALADLVALARHRVGAGGADGPDQKPDHTPDPEADERPDHDLAGDRARAASELGALLDGPPTTFVVDDYQFAEADEIDPVLAEVAALLDPQSKIIVCSTRRPSGLIGRLHGPDRAKVEVISAEVTALTAEEARAAEEQRADSPSATPVPDDVPTALIEQAVAAGDTDRALALLTAHLEEIGAGRAAGWLFRLPPSRRDDVPPAVLAAAQAAADGDRTLFDARRRVDEAVSGRARADAIFALGAVHARRGELAAAADAFEAAIAAAPSAEGAASATTWLGVVRWWAGDLEASRQDLATATDPIGRWARVEVELASEALHAAAVLAAPPPPGSADASAAEPPALLSVRARVAWAQGDTESAAELAREAYESARPAGGFGLAAASLTYLWMMLDAGEVDEVLEIADYLDRRVGRQDLFTRTNVALLQLAAAQLDDDDRGADRAVRRLAECRVLGFAPIEAEARRRLPVLAAAPPPLEIGVLGPTTVLVDGVPVEVEGWSRTTLEVLLYLALVQGQTATRNAVTAAVWPDSDVDAGRSRLREALSQIRTALEPHRPLGEPSSYLITQRQRVTLRAVTDYERARTLAEAGDHVAALALFRGELLDEEAFLDWADALQRTARSFQLQLAEQVLYDSAEHVDDAELDTVVAIAALELIVGEQPWDVASWTLLEELHRRSGADEDADDVARRHAEARTGFF